jgi:uncharacterized damage-inducible protein DinB
MLTYRCQLALVPSCHHHQKNETNHMKTLVETPTATLSTLVKKTVSYNLWANSQLIGFLRTKPKADLNIEVASSFSSLRKTLLHIHTTEVFWLSIIQESVYTPPSDEMSISELMDSMINTSEAFLSFVLSLSEEEILEEVFFTSPWAEAARGRFDFIQHAMMHSTYHRGQLVTIGRHLGYLDAPMTDYNFYLTFAY